LRILIEGKSYADYLAKCHEAFRTGLRALFDTRCFGRGYPRYWPFFRSYDQILKHVFGEEQPDVLLADSYFPHDAKGFKYIGFDRVPCGKGFILGDYWDVTGDNRQQFIDYVLKSKSNFVISLFPQPLSIFAGSAISDLLIYLPPCFDPAIFKDWRLPKTYDVGFLAAGTVEPSSTYPERARIHQQLRKKELKYLYAAHPGWGSAAAKHPLVGSGFSRAINSCRMFVTTAGSLRNPHAKYFEVLASKSMLLADEPVAADQIGLKDGLNYVRFTEDNVEHKIDYFLRHPEEADAIAARGYQLALKRHSCYNRAIEFYDEVLPKLGLKP
jgi:hypothetical protein